MLISNSIKQIDEVIVGASCSLVTIHDGGYNIGIMWSSLESTSLQDGEYRHGFMIGGFTYEISKEDFDDFVNREDALE